MAEYIYTMRKARKAHGDKVILDDVTLSFLPGAKIGVVGPNGAGKSTVLKIMAGLEQPSNGDAFLSPGYTVGILLQEPPLDESKTVLENVQDASPRPRASSTGSTRSPSRWRPTTRTRSSRRWASSRRSWTTPRLGPRRPAGAGHGRLGCPPGDWAVTNLSGGEKRRVALCKLLLEAPDLLLLDEPTNHLDAESVNWLEQHLAQYPGTVVAITHDRYFLDNVAGWIMELDRGRAIGYEGNYSTYLETKQTRLKVEGQKDAKRAKRLKEELEWVRSNAKGRQAKSKARLARYEEMAAEADKMRKLDFEEIQIPPGPRLGNMVVEVEHLSKAFGDKVLIDDLSFTLPRNGIVGIIGPNGAGKTTLFKMIQGLEEADSGSIKVGDTVKISYVDQSRANIDPKKTLWAVVSDELDYINVGQVEMPSRAYVSAFGFKGPDQQKRPASSPAVSATASTSRSPSSRAATSSSSTSPPTTWTSRRSPRWRTPCWSSPAAPWSSPTTAGSWTASPRTSWRTRATPSGSGSRATSSRTRRTRWSGSAPTPPGRTAPPTRS